MYFITIYQILIPFQELDTTLYNQIVHNSYKKIIKQNIHIKFHENMGPNFFIKNNILF